MLPAVLAAAIALAAAALAGTIAGVPWWGVVVAGVATGASVPVAFAANGYLDQLLVEPLVLAAAGALRAAGGGRGRVLGIVALLAAWLVHWQFGALTTVLLAILAPACPRSPANAAAADASPRRPRAGGDRRRRRVPGIASLLLGTPGFPRTPSGLSGHRSAGTSRTSWIGTGSSSRSRSRPWPVRSSHSIGGASAAGRRGSRSRGPRAGGGACVRARSHPAAGPNASSRWRSPCSRAGTRAPPGVVA